MEKNLANKILNKLQANFHAQFVFILLYIYIQIYFRIYKALIIIIIIIPEQFIKRRKWWFGPPHQGRFDIFNDNGRECSRLNPSYQRNITFACTGCYQLHPHHRLGIITRDLSPVPIYRPRKDG